MTKILNLPHGWANEADELWICKSGSVSLMIKDISGDLTVERTSSNFFTKEEMEELNNETADIEETECPIVFI